MSRDAALSSRRADATAPSRDAALTRRILVTLLLVLAIDALFVGSVAALLRPWFAPALSGAPDAAALLALALPATALVAWAQLRYARREALSAADATPVSDEEYPDLHARVRRLATGVDVPVPELAVSDASVPNSLTVGGPRGATLVVSEGLLSTLSDEELDAVLAHELAHVRNRDATVMTLATFLPALAGDYSLLSDLGWDGGTRRLFWGVVLAALYVPSANVIDAPLFSLRYTFLYGMLVAFVLLFGGVALGALATPVVSLASRLSHDREFAADRAGAVLTGSPAGMASALATLADDDARPDRDARTSAGGVRELCFVPGGFGDDGDSSLPVEVRTHPPTDERVARLRTLAAELEG